MLAKDGGDKGFHCEYILGYLRISLNQFIFFAVFSQGYRQLFGGPKGQ